MHRKVAGIRLATFFVTNPTQCEATTLYNTITMKLHDLLPTIDVDDGWGRAFKHYAPLFISYAKQRTPVNDWDEDVSDQLFRSVNCVSSLRQGNFYLTERDAIRQHWDELMEPLGIIADHPDVFCAEQCYEVFNTIKRLIHSNRPAASLRLIASFQPLQLTTTVTWYHLDEIYHSMENAGVDLPDGYGGDAIQKSHYLQTYINSCYPEADACERATFAWRLPDLIYNLKSATAAALTQTEDTPLDITADIRTTTEVLKMRLAIPDYQRPYVWDTTNVGQMLTDIKNSMEQGKRQYRIGSIILHNSDIVDGQQRITTLCLIKLAWASIEATGKAPCCELKFANEQSFAHIKENYEFIRSWLNSLQENRRMEFLAYLYNCCEFVVIQVSGQDSLSMAFKLFDSQNGRGKPLEAYNLLKAFHLRAMSACDESLKIARDREWEQSARFGLVTNGGFETVDILKQLFDEQLYRTRIWSKGADAWAFSKKKIGEFKGMQIDKQHGVSFPFQNKQLLLFMTEKFYQMFLKDTMPTCARFNDGDGSDISPFVSINQPIVNGNNFFEYIHSYAEIYKRLFLELDSYQMRDFKQFYRKYCLAYPGNWRVGDGYIRQMYQSVIMLLFDKFGEKGVNEYYRHLYVLTYCLRRQKQRVYYSTVAKYPAWLFSMIENAKDLSTLHRLEELTADPKYKSFNGFEFGCYDEVIQSLMP